MCRNLLPAAWTTERLAVQDSTLAEVDDLQQINDAVPQTRGWGNPRGHEDSPCSMRAVLQDGALPPTPDSSREFFRLQSIRLRSSGTLIGFLAVYHGFPQEDTFWVCTVTFEPQSQGKGYGPELMARLFEAVEKLGSYTRVQTCVSLTNWPSLRSCLKIGLDRMVRIEGDKVHADGADAHLVVEKSLADL